VPQIPVEEIPRRIAEVHSHITESVADQKQIAVDEMRQELSRHWPEIESLRNLSLTEAMTSVLSERLVERESELTASLQAADARERKLRRKLERALTEVQSLATPVKSESPVQTLVALEGISVLRDEWKTQRKQLDLKMSELTRGMSSTLGEVYFSTPRSNRS
jgi:hypothetical protein